MKWAAVLVVVAIAIDGLPALNLPQGSSSDAGEGTSSAIDVGVSKAGGVTPPPSDTGSETNSVFSQNQRAEERLPSVFQARSSLAHRGPIRPFPHIPNHGPSGTHAYNQHRNYANENGHYGHQTRNHGHNSGHRNGFWNHAYNIDPLARGAGHHRYNHFVSGPGNRHQGGSSAEYIDPAHDASQFSEDGYQGADANKVHFVDSATNTENQETNSGEYDSGYVSDESESSFGGSGYVDKSFLRGLDKRVNTDQFESEPDNEASNSGQHGSKAATETGDLNDVLKRGLNNHFVSATANRAHSGKYNAIARHGNGYQDNTNGDLRGFHNRPHFGNQRVNPGYGNFAPTDNVNYGPGNRYHSSPNEILNGLLNRARDRLSYPGPENPRPVPVKYINKGFAPGGHNDQYGIGDDEEEDANAKYISDILTQAQRLLKHGAVPNSYGATPAHHNPGPQRRPVYETPNLGIRFYDEPTGSYMATPASTADDDDTYGGVAQEYVVPTVIIPEFNGYPNGQYYGPNYYRNGGFGSGSSYKPGIDRSVPTTIFGRNPSVSPLSTIPVSNVANVDNAVVIDRVLTFEPLSPFKPLPPLTPLTPLTILDTDYEGTSGDASETIIDKDLLRGTFKSASSLKNDLTTVINKDLTSKTNQKTHQDSDNDVNSKIDNGTPTDKTALPQQTGKPVKGNEKIDEAFTKITNEKKDDEKLVTIDKDDDKTIINPGKSIIIDKNTVTNIYNHDDVSKKDKTVKSIEKVLETSEKSEPIEKKDDGTIKYDKSNEKITTKKDSGKNDKPNRNDNDKISNSGKSFVIDKTVVINSINKDKSGNGKESNDQTSTKTREILGTESKSETPDKSDEETTTNGQSIVIDESTVIKLTGKDLKYLGKNDKTVEQVKRDLEKDGSHVIGKADDKTTKPVKLIVDKTIVIQNDKSDITNNDSSTKNGKTSDKTTEIKNADKNGDITDKKDKTLAKYDKSDNIGKIIDGINKKGKSTETDNTDNQGKNNIKRPKTDANVEKALESDDTSKPVHNNDDDSNKNGKSNVIGKTKVVKSIHKNESGTETIDETSSSETKEVVGNYGKSDSNDKSDYETIKNSKTKENKGLKDSDGKSKTVEKIKKLLGYHAKPDDFGNDNDGNTKLVKRIVIDKDTVIKNFLKDHDKLNSTRKDDNESTKKGQSKLTEDTDKDGQDKNKTDKTIEKIDEKNYRPDAINKENDNATENGKSSDNKNTTLIKKDSRKHDELDNIDYEETTKNGKSTVADKSWEDKNEKITKKVSGADDELNKNNDVDKTITGKSTVTKNSSGVKNANDDGDGKSPERGNSRGPNIKSVTKNIKKDENSKDDKSNESDKTSQFKNNSEYTTNDVKTNYRNRATKRAVGSGKHNGPSDEDFHDDADNIETGKGGKHVNNGNKNENKSSKISKKYKKEVESDKSDGDSINEDSVGNENDQPSRPGKVDKSPSNVVGSKNDDAPGTSDKDDKSESKDGKKKRNVGSENDDNANSNETYSKGGKTQSNDIRNVVEFPNEDALGKSEQKDEYSMKTDKVEGRKNDHESDSENIGNDSTSEDDKLTLITKETVSVKTGQDDNTNGRQDQSESDDDSSDGTSYKDSSSRDGDGETDKDLEQNDDETDCDDIENDNTSNDEHQENVSECGDNFNNEDREDVDKNDLFGKSEDKEVVGSETGENKDSNENDEDASSNSAKGDESGPSGSQKDNKGENEDAPEESGEDGKYRNPGDKKVIGSENAENKDSDEDDKDVSSNFEKSGKSGKTGDKNNKKVKGSQNKNTPKKSHEDSKSRNNSDKEDKNVVEHENRNNKDFHENSKDTSSNSKEDGKTGSKRGYKQRNYTLIGKVVGDKNPRVIDSTTSENDGTLKDDKLTVTSEKPKTGQDEINDTNNNDSSSKKHEETSVRSENKSDKFRRNDGHKRNRHTKVGEALGQKEHRNDHENDQSTESNKKPKSGQDVNDDTKRDESKNYDSSIKDNKSDKSAQVDQFGRKRGHKRRNNTKVGTTVGHKNQDTDSSNSENDETSKNVKLTVIIEKPKTGQDETNDGTNDESKNKDLDDDNATSKSVKGTKSRKNNGQQHKIITKIGTTVVNKNVPETDESAIINETPKSSQGENNNTNAGDGSIKKGSDNNDDVNTSHKGDKSRRKHNHKRRNYTTYGTIVGHKKNHKIDFTKSENDETLNDDKLTVTSEKPIPRQDENSDIKKDGADTSDSSSKEDVNGNDDNIQTEKSVKSHKFRRYGGHKHKNLTKIGKLVGETNDRETGSTITVNDGNLEDDKLTETSEKPKTGQDENKNTDGGDGSVKKVSDNNDDDNTSDKSDKANKSGKKHGHERTFHTKIGTVAGHKENHKIDFTKSENYETLKDDKLTVTSEKPKPSLNENSDSKKDGADTSDSSSKEDVNGSDDYIKTEKSVKSHKSRQYGGHKHKNSTKIGKLVGENNDRETGSTITVNDGNSEDDTLTETSEKPKTGQDENQNTDAGDGSVKKVSDNNDDGNTSDKSDKSGKKHGHKRRNHTKIGTVASYKENHKIDFTKSENDETLKDEKLTVASEKPKSRQDENSDSNKDGSDKSDNSSKEDVSGIDDYIQKEKSVKSHKSRKNGGHKHKNPTKIEKLVGENDDREIESPNTVNDGNSEDYTLTETSGEKPKTDQDENYNTNAGDGSINKGSDNNDDDNTSDKSDKDGKSGKKHGHKRRIYTKIGTVASHKKNHEIDSTKSVNDEISKVDKLTFTSENPKTSQDENNDGTNNEFNNKDSDDNNATVKETISRKNNGQKHKIITKIGTTVVNKKVHETDESTVISEKPKSSQDDNNDTKHDDSTFNRGESVGKGDKNDSKNLESDNDENVDLDEDGSEKSEKEIQGKNHKKSHKFTHINSRLFPTGTGFHKFVGRKGQKKYQETDLLNNNNSETSEGAKSTEINEKPVSNKPGQGKNISDKKAATERKNNRNHGFENGEDISREGSDDDDEGKLGSNGSIQEKRDAGFKNDDLPKKSGKGGNHGRNGSSQNKAVGPETGDSKTPNEHDDDEPGVAEKGERIHGKKHRKSHKVVGRKGHKKNHETDLLNIDNTATSESGKSTDINKKTTSAKPGQEQNKNDENEDTEKKIIRNHKSENSEDRENSDDDEDELSKKSGKGKRRFVKKIAVSDNDDAPKKSEGDKPGRHGGKQDKAVETENGNKEYSKEHVDDDKGKAEKSNKGGRISGKKHENSHKVLERKGHKNDHVTDSGDNENDGVSNQVKSTVDLEKPVSDENSEDQKDESVKINKEEGSEKGDRLTNEARDGKANEDGKQTELTNKKLKIRDYGKRIKNNVTKTKKDLQSSNVNGSGPNDRDDDGGEHSKDSKLTDQNTKSVNRNQNHKIHYKTVKGLPNHESGDFSDSDTTEKSKSTSNSKKAVTEETDDSNSETSEGAKSTEINEKPVSDKPGQGKNISDKKTATERKNNRNHGFENGEDTSREGSDDDDEGKLGSNGSIQEKRDAGFKNDDLPKKSGKGGNHGRNGSSQNKAVGPETGDSKTPNEHDDDEPGVAEKGERIHGKKHRKSHKVVGRKGHKKNHETDLLNIDNTATSESGKSTDINKKTTSAKPGLEQNKNDENEDTEKKIIQNHKSENSDDRENSDDDEDELSKKSGKGRRRFVKKIAVSDNDDAPKKSEGDKPGRHGGKQDKAVETENGNKEYSKEHVDDDKGKAEKSNKGGRISGKKHENSHKVLERKGHKNDHVTDSGDNENDGVSNQVKSTVDLEKPVSDENSEDQKDESVKINKEEGSEKGDRLTNEARDGKANEDGKQTELTNKKLKIRDYGKRIKNNVTKTKKDLQSSNVNGSGPNDRVDDGGEHSKDSKLTDQNTKSVNRNQKHKIHYKTVKGLPNHESGDFSDSDTTEKSKSTSNSKKAVTEETDNNDKNYKTSTTNDVSGHEDETSDDSNSAVKDKQSKTKKHGNKDTSSQVIRKHNDTKDKDGSKTDANTSNDKTSNEKDSSSHSKNNSADDNEQQDNESEKDSTNNSNADEIKYDLEQENTNTSSENDDAVRQNTGLKKEEASDTKNTAVTNTSKAVPKIHRRTKDIATKTRNLIKRKLATITITLKQHTPKLNTEDTNNNFAGKTTADSTSGKTTESTGLGKTEEISNRNAAENNSSDSYDEEKSRPTSTDIKNEKSGSQSDVSSSSSSTNSEGESKTASTYNKNEKSGSQFDQSSISMTNSEEDFITSSTDTTRETSDNQSDESSRSNNETADRQSKDETKCKSYKSRKEESSNSASGYGSGAEQESLTKDGKKATYKHSSEDSAHSEQQADSKYTEESSNSNGKTVESGQKSASEEANKNSSDSYIEESDGQTKKSKKDSASAEDKKNEASSSSEYKKVDSNGNSAARKSISRRKSFKSKLSSFTDEEYSSSR